MENEEIDWKFVDYLSHLIENSITLIAESGVSYVDLALLYSLLGLY